MYFKNNEVRQESEIIKETLKFVIGDDEFCLLCLFPPLFNKTEWKILLSPSGTPTVFLQTHQRTFPRFLHTSWAFNCSSDGPREQRGNSLPSILVQYKSLSWGFCSMVLSTLISLIVRTELKDRPNCKWKDSTVTIFFKITTKHYWYSYLKNCLATYIKNNPVPWEIKPSHEERHGI